MSALFGRVDNVNAPPFTCPRGSVPTGDHIDGLLALRSNEVFENVARVICNPPGTCAAARNACLRPVIPTAGQKFPFATSGIAFGSLTAFAKRSAVPQTTEYGAHDAHSLRNGKTNATLLK